MVSNMWVTTDDNDGVLPRTLKVALVLLGLALLVTSVGWYVSAQPKFDEGRFDSCEVSGRPGGSVLVLSFTYGVNEEVSPTLDTTGSDWVISLRERRGGGDTPMLAIHGSVTFMAPGDGVTVRYPDGKRLECSPG